MNICETYSAIVTGFALWILWYSVGVKRELREQSYEITKRMLRLLDESEQWKIIAEALAPEPHKSAIKEMNAPPEPTEEG